jgi:hypothetical protein
LELNVVIYQLLCSLVARLLPAIQGSLHSCSAFRL